METNTWKIEKDLCRCCHTEGSFKNLAEPCTEMGEEEIYCDMLRDSFDIDLTPVPGNLCAPTFTICEPCILRLRDASTFKKQVMQCEKKFREMYSKNVIIASAPAYVISVKEEPEVTDALIKYELEKHVQDVDSGSDDDKLSVGVKYSDMEDGDDDDEDDYPLLKATLLKDVSSKKKGNTSNKRKATKSSAKTKPQKKLKEKKEKIEEESKDAEDEDKKVKKRGARPSKTESMYIVQEEGDLKQYLCSECSRPFKNPPCAVQHYRHVHLKLRPKLRSCYYCEVKVPGYMRAFHLEKEHGIPAPTCNACGKKFAFPNQVLRHQKNYHMGEKRYSCSVCDMKFTTSANLSQHEAKHSSERIHKCEYCEKAFKWRKNLTTHVMMHLDDRRHVCRVCQESFVQQTSLKYHIIKKHPEIV